MNRVTKATAAATTAVVVFAFLPGASASATGSCGPIRREGPQRIQTFQIDVSAARHTYSAGQRARFLVSVERGQSAQHTAQNTNLAVTQPGVPAEGANVILIMTAGRRTLGAFGVTDQDGNARLAVALPRSVRPGSADIWVRASYQPVRCVEEYAEFYRQRMLRITK